MSNFFATNVGNVVGTVGDDRLSVTYNFDAGGVSLTNLSGTLATGYSGTFDGTGANNVVFSGIENFSFTDNGGGDDIINTGDGDDYLSGGLSNDILRSGGGADTIDGGDGNDIWGADKSFAHKPVDIDLNDALSGYLGGGYVQNIEGLNLKTGSAGDHITGSSKVAMNDVIDTGRGSDVITLWGGGTDDVNGGAGNDMLVVTYNTDANNDVWLTDLAVDTVNGGYQGTFDGRLANNLVFHGIERFTYIDKFGGNDIINTGKGNDKLLGGGGNDVLNSGAGNDIVKGGNGDDNIHGGNGDDNIHGGNGNDTVNGGAGADTVSGGIGIDRILGGTGDDVMSGGAGPDNMVGGGGNDTIDGGGGADRLTGNGGYDIFVFADGFGRDTVVDFVFSNKEKIDLSAVTDIVGFNDLVNHHLITDENTGYAEIVDGRDAIVLRGIHESDIGAGLGVSANDFIF